MDLEDLINGFACRFEKKKIKKDSITLMKSPICSLLYSSLGSSWPLREKNTTLDMKPWLALALAVGWLKLDETCCLK